MYKESASYLREHIGGREPAILLILGSGLSYMADLCEDSVSIMYADIPGFKASTAPGHEGRLVFGDICGRHVMVMQGRMHCYEGYSAAEVTYPISVARALGVKMLLVTCATGGVNEDYNVGDIMMISDHIKLMGDSPLRGKNNDELGVRFPDMTYAYTPKLRETA
ncbi:MAG: purine-nucleoside phosphorylase, partial [Clostridia bacterium]